MSELYLVTMLASGMFGTFCILFAGLTSAFSGRSNRGRILDQIAFLGMGFSAVFVFMLWAAV